VSKKHASEHPKTTIVEKINKGGASGEKPKVKRREPGKTRKR